MFEKMNDGGSIVQTQSQFRCPKSNYVSETTSFNIKIQKVTKSFRKIYTKGVVDGHGVVLTSNRLLLKGQQNQRAIRPKIKEEK
jgi:hypothetical protein